MDASASDLNILDHCGEAAEVLEAIETRLAPEDRLRVATASIQGGWARFSDGNDLARGRRLIERGLSLADGFPRPPHQDTRSLVPDEDSDPRRRCRGGDATQPPGHRAGRGTRRSPDLVLGLYNESAALCDAGRLGSARSSAQKARELARAWRTIC